MDLALVMDEIAALVRPVDAGVTVFAYPPKALVPPAVVVSFPLDLVYNMTGAGDRLKLPVMFIVGRPSDGKSVRNRLAAHCGREGPGSFKAAIESRPPGGYATFDDVLVSAAEFGEAEIAGVPFVTVMFTLDIAG